MEPKVWLYAMVISVRLCVCLLRMGTSDRMSAGSIILSKLLNEYAAQLIRRDIARKQKLLFHCRQIKQNFPAMPIIYQLRENDVIYILNF
jgi:hypothetical protein